MNYQRSQYTAADENIRRNLKKTQEYLERDILYAHRAFPVPRGDILLYYSADKVYKHVELFLNDICHGKSNFFKLMARRFSRDSDYNAAKLKLLNMIRETLDCWKINPQLSILIERFVDNFTKLSRSYDAHEHVDDFMAGVKATIRK